MAVSETADRIDHLHSMRIAAGSVTTHTDGVATVKTGFNRVIFAAPMGVDAASTACIPSVKSVSGGNVEFEMLEEDATVGTTAAAIYYLIIGD